ncbi:MAG TPA: glycosyl hydrolase 53 family protein [Bacteroidales bacterium]|nr:glycosyl hydrolase 53 family protein [Bacteroidales bacterium]
MKHPVILLTFFLFFLLSCSKKNAGQENTAPQPVYYTWDYFCMGADLSYANELEDNGAVYRDSSQVKDIFRIFREHGANTVRVRLWHDPQWEKPLTGGKLYSDLADAEKTIRRAKELGMAVDLDIHFSDTWADPGRQDTPAAWDSLSLDGLKDSVYQYTLDVLNYLKSQSVTPEMVQIGNEVNAGMLWPLGKVQNDVWTSFGALLNSGIRAVRDFSAGSAIKPLIILHVAQLQNADWWISHVIQQGQVTDFDILGISHYSKWSTVNSMQQITTTIKSLRTSYGKEVMIVETAYPWTPDNADSYPNTFGIADAVSGYPLTQQGQEKYLEDLTQAVISGGGKGIMYWEPDWITSSMHDSWGTGSSWDNCTFFDFSGNWMPGLVFMTRAYPF